MGRGLKRQAGLSDAARPDQGQQTAGSVFEVGGNRRQFLLSANERCGL